ncbi:MAG: MCE family protein [candidate division Zixibacteria bacterium]|nr:MCE family protein [candidate division Zixibacteria bacterium]
MRRSNRVKWSELWVGLLVMFGFVILIWASLTGGGTSIFEDKRNFSVYFENVQGLTRGSPVWISGVEVGNVRSITFDKSLRKIEVMGRVQNKVWHLVSADSKAKIGSIGLIGDKFLEIVPGDPSAAPLEDNGVLVAIEDDIGKVFREGSDAITSVKEIARNLSEIMDKINSGENTLGRMLSDDSLYIRLNATLGSLSETVERFNSHQDEMFESIEDGVESFGRLTDALLDSGGTVGRLLFDSTLYGDLTNLVADLSSIAGKMESGEGSAGALVNDIELYENTKNMLARLENLILDIEKNPRKYFKFSVF